MRWGKPTKNKKRRDPRYFLNEGPFDAFDELDAATSKAPTGEAPDAHYAASEADIPRVLEAMNGEIAALGPRPTQGGREGMSARQARAEKEMEIAQKYGLVRQDNNYYIFKIKGGATVNVPKQ